MISTPCLTGGSERSNPKHTQQYRVSRAGKTGGVHSGPTPRFNRRGDDELSPAQLVKLGRMAEAVAARLCLKPQQYDHECYDPSMEVLMRIPRDPLYCTVKQLCRDLILDIRKLESLVGHLRKRKFAIKKWRRDGSLWRLMIEQNGWLCVCRVSDDYWRSVYD